MYGYGELIDLIWLESLQMKVEHWFVTEVLVWTTLVQLIAAAVGIGIAYLVSRMFNVRVNRWNTKLRMTERSARLLLSTIAALDFPVFTLVALLLIQILAQNLAWPVILLTTIINLVLFWIAIRLATQLIRNETLSRVVALFAFAVAALDIVGLLQPTILYLEEIGMRLGNTYVSALDVIKGGSELALFLWLAVMASRVLEQRVHRARSLTPSLKLLTGKLLKVTLVAAAILIALNSIGIDLTAFAVFSGAVGVGVGFGLQKPISNLISGIILLLDRSIKPGDVIEVSEPGTHTGHFFGWVTALNARYASVTTRDGTEWLIPNEDLITKRVINWSFNDNRLRLLTPFGVSYDSDVRTAIRLAVEAAKENPRVLKDPAPVCRLMGFGDSSVNLELRIWITDPANGIINVRSEILLAMWDKFRENGVRIPFAQRDLHIKDDSQLRVTLERSRQSNTA